jgi:hypothetical protein
MTTEEVMPPPQDLPAPDQPAQPAQPAPTLLGRLWSTSQLLAAIVVAGGALLYLLFHPDNPAPPPSGDGPPEPAEVVSANVVRLRPNSTLEKRIQVVTVSRVEVSAPVLRVTGTVVASMRHGENGAKSKKKLALFGVELDLVPSFWQFNAPEVLSTYADWKKAIDDIKFYTKQLADTEKLGKAREAAQEGVVKRKMDLVIAGTDTKEVLAAAEADLKALKLTNRKDLHDANNNLLTAQRNEAALARQLQQAGLDPDLLREEDPNYDIVMADVPEHRLKQIKIGQDCEARFFALPDDKPFPGKVRKIAPVVSKERRTLRVLFLVEDKEDKLRPGMFAEIGLGTNERQVLLMPAEGVVHVGKEDYALVETSGNAWRVARLTVGEVYGDKIEVTNGISEGDRVMSAGAILLKTFIIRATQGQPASSTAAKTDLTRRAARDR